MEKGLSHKLVDEHIDQSQQHQAPVDAPFARKIISYRYSAIYPYEVPCLVHAGF